MAPWSSGLLKCNETEVKLEPMRTIPPPITEVFAIMEEKNEFKI
jgi:hypothetical protein